MSKSTKIIAALGVAAGLGVAALPAATFAATTQVVPLSVKVPTTIELGATNTGDFLSDTAGTLKLTAGNGNTAAKTVLTAKDNNSAGWKVTVASTDAATKQKGKTLYNGTADNADAINPLTFTGGTLSGANSGWGIKLSGTNATDDYLKTTNANSAFNATDYTAVTENAIVYAHGTPTPNAGVTMDVEYGIWVADGQAAGTYEGSITYTIANL